MATQSELEAAMLTAASTVTVGDLVALAQWFAKLVGGHDNAAALVEQARAQAVQEALDIAEGEKLNQETQP